MSAPGKPGGLQAAVPLLPYQRRWFLDRSRFKLGRMARQTGKTFTTTLEIVDDCFEAFTRKRVEPWVILSRGERQAKEAIDTGIKRHAKAYELGFEYNEFDWSDGYGPKYRAYEVELPGGQVITALPANPDTARGYSRNLFLDEFAIHKDSREIWGALFPLISRGWKIRVTSTPKGRNNKFFELCTGKDPIWSRHTVTIYDAVREGLDFDIEMMKAALNDPELWAQEYECEFIDGASAWLTHEQINDAEQEEAGKPEHYAGNYCFVGVDIARRRDLFVIWVWEKVGDVFWTREVIARQNITFAEQDELLDSVMHRYKVARVAMDQTGMGEKPVEDAQRKFGPTVEGVILSGPRGLLVATSARQKFEDCKVRIPAGDQAIRSDLRQVEKEVSTTGAPRVVTNREGGSHADRAWAAFLGLAAADGEVATCQGFRPVPRSAGQFHETPDDGDRRFRMRADEPVSHGNFGRGTW
jgi:phage FluMu gp28-like protein